MTQFHLAFVCFNLGRRYQLSKYVLLCTSFNHVTLTANLFHVHVRTSISKTYLFLRSVEPNQTKPFKNKQHFSQLNDWLNCKSKKIYHRNVCVHYTSVDFCRWFLKVQRFCSNNRNYKSLIWRLCYISKWGYVVKSHNLNIVCK